jgi:hypothetical protein
MSRSILNSINTTTNPYAGGYMNGSNQNQFNIPNPYGNGSEDISWLL